MKTKLHSKGLASRSEQPSTDLPRISFARRRVNRSLDTGTVLTLLRHGAPRHFELAEVVGRWVWIQFQQEPARETRRQLAQLGFHWNDHRQAWQHPCGLYRDRRVNFDPRRKFGSYFAADRMPA
jgi:hypothetical protein